VPRIERSATITWEGNVARGGGTITGGTGAFTELPYSLPARVGRAEGKTSPEELLAAAHGGCITMSLATELTQAGTPPRRLDTHVLIVMDEVEGEGHQIVASHVTFTVDADAENLGDLIEKADAGCPFSTLLKKAGVAVQISLTESRP
jgi:osmotically inducible protein OsmC